MSMQNLKDNLDRYTHAEAQAAQMARKDALAAFQKGVLQPAQIDRGIALNRQPQQIRGPEDEPVTAAQWLSAEAAVHGVGPSDRELDVYEKYWMRKLHVRENDEVREGKVKQYARDRWTLDALFKDAGCPLPGPQKAPYAPSVQKAFNSNTTQVIFPFYYAAAIQAGILASPLVDRLIMEDIPVNSHTADHAMMTDVTGDRTTSRSGEGATATEIVIAATNHPVNLRKYQTRATATYESIRLQRIPVFERGLMRVGQQFMIQITERCIDVLVNGDGTTTAPGGGAAPTYACNVSGSPVYKDIIKLDTTFPQGYEVLEGIFVMPIDTLTKLLDMAEFKDPLAGWHYQNDGAYPTPIGKAMYRWDATAGASGITGSISNYGTGTVMQVKTGISVVKYTEGGLLVETDRIINGQFDQVITSTWTDFAIWDRKGVVVGTSF